MTVNTPALDELPLRAQIGYVLKYATTHRGEMTPAVAAGVLRAKGVVHDNPEGVLAVAEEVFEQRGIDWGDGDD